MTSIRLAGHRILVGPNDIGSVGSRMASALAAHGADVLFFNANEHAFYGKVDESPNLRRLFGGATRLTSRWKENRGIQQLVGSLLARIVKLGAFIKTCLWAQTVVMVGGKGFFGGSIEYLLLRGLGKRVIHAFAGTASRPRYLSGYARTVFQNGQINEKELKRLVLRVRRQAQRIGGISRHASLVIENPLCGHFQQRPFINWFKLGVPLDVAALEARQRKTDNTPQRTTGKIRVLHSPSRPEIKGSVRIQATIEKLIQEGLPLELRMVTGVAQAQVLHEIAQADFVVDQLYSDSPLAGFAAEASALGRAAVVGGYGWNLFPHILRPEEMPPTAICHPDELESCLRTLAMNPARRLEVASSTHAFLLNQWSPDAFAERFVHIVTGNIPADWWVSPAEVRFMHGLGMEEAALRKLVHAIVENHGPDYLQVNHIPELRELLIAFGRGEPTPY